MERRKELLMKNFASILRARTNGKPIPRAVKNGLYLHLKRKELFGVVKRIYQGEIPPHLDVAVLEKDELLELIQDEMHIIADVTAAWSDEALQQRTGATIAETQAPKASNAKDDKARPAKSKAQ